MRRPASPPFIVVAALLPASLVLSHDLSFLLEYGRAYAAVLRATGHDGRWEMAVAFVLAASVALAVVAGARLVVLWQSACRLDRGCGPSFAEASASFAHVLLAVWARLAVATTVAFLLLENVERIAAGGTAPGLAPIVGAGGVSPLPILALVSLAVAAVGALLAWAPTALRARIAAALAARRRRPAGWAPRPAAAPAIRPMGPLAWNLGRRAPPPLVA